jgi:hypothetical protein
VQKIVNYHTVVGLVKYKLRVSAHERVSNDAHINITRQFSFGVVMIVTASKK